MPETMIEIPREGLSAIPDHLYSKFERLMKSNKEWETWDRAYNNTIVIRFLSQSIFDRFVAVFGSVIPYEEIN